jgi:alkylated DNA repair dioxygenase AlkB
MVPVQPELPGLASAAPEGFAYRAGLVTPEHEAELLAVFRRLPFRPFEFHGFEGKRRVVSFGFRYDYGVSRLVAAPDIPDVLLPLRAAAAAFAGIAPESLRQALVTEYKPGAGLGWHRDRAEFGEVVGVSLASRCRFLLRRQSGGQSGGKWQRYGAMLEPRSAYVLRGAARSVWEHSVPALTALRFSVTFRSMGRTELG